MRDLGELLRWLWLRGNASNHGTWLLHGGIAAGLSFVTPRGAPTFFYLAREVEQIVNHLARHEELDPVDHVMDVVSAAAGEALVRAVQA